MNSMAIYGINELTRSLTEIQKKMAEFKKSNKDIFIKENENALKSLIETVIPKILSSSGQNIGFPFRRKKTDSSKHIKFNVPKGSIAGVRSGATYFALMSSKGVSYVSENGESNSRDIIREVTEDKIIYGFKASSNNKDVTESINFSVGVTKEWLKREAERRVNIFQKQIEKALGANI